MMFYMGLLSGTLIGFVAGVVFTVYIDRTPKG